MNLNRTLIVVRFLYFFIAISHSATYQWSVLYFYEYFSLSQFGLLHGIKYLVRFIGSIMWGYFGDYWFNQKFQLFITGKLFCIICMTHLYLIPYLSSSTLFTILSMDFSWQFVFAIAVSCGEIYGSSSYVLLESITLILSGNEYGSNRFYLALGHGFGSVVCAILTQIFMSHSMFILIYDISIIIALIILIIEMKINKSIVSLTPNYTKISINTVDSNQLLQYELDNNSSITIYSILFNPGFIIIIFNVFIFGIAQSVVLEYLFLFILNEYNSKEIVCGLTTIVMVSGELLIFYNSTYLLNNIGILGLDFLAHISYIIRVLYYTLLPFTLFYSWFILIIEPLHGFTFGGFWIASVEYINCITPTKYKSTIMGILNGTFVGFGYMVGSILGGLIYNYIGGVFMYRLFAFIIFIWMIVYNLLFAVLIYLSPKTKFILHGQN